MDLSKSSACISNSGSPARSVRVCSSRLAVSVVESREGRMPSGSALVLLAPGAWRVAPVLLVPNLHALFRPLVPRLAGDPHALANSVDQRRLLGRLLRTRLLAGRSPPTSSAGSVSTSDALR